MIFLNWIFICGTGVDCLEMTIVIHNPMSASTTTFLWLHFAVTPTLRQTESESCLVDFVILTAAKKLLHILSMQ